MIKALISDFDGTLVDTFDANFNAYQKAFSDVGKDLQKKDYEQCFGYRYDSFMAKMGISDIKIMYYIKERKKEYYPLFYNMLVPNYALIELITSFHMRDGLTAIASTARRENLMGVLEYFDLKGCFDLIYTGEDVCYGKPNPEIYIKTITSLNVKASEALIFEDSIVGIEAAKKSGAKYIKIQMK